MGCTYHPNEYGRESSIKVKLVNDEFIYFFPIWTLDIPKLPSATLVNWVIIWMVICATSVHNEKSMLFNIVYIGFPEIKCRVTKSRNIFLGWGKKHSAREWIFGTFWNPKLVLNPIPVMLKNNLSCWVGTILTLAFISKCKILKFISEKKYYIKQKVLETMKK